MALLTVSFLACDLTAPDRTDAYGFRLQPENLVFRWPADRLPVRYFAQNLGPLPEYVRSGIRVWETQFLYGEFSAQVVTDSSVADVRVLLEGGVPPASPLTSAPPANACEGVTSAALGPANELSGPLVVRLRWFTGFAAADIANCLARVTAHEIGHTLGLFQHSDRASDLMYGPPFGFPQVREPSLRDRWTVQTLYHTQPDIPPAP